MRILWERNRDRRDGDGGLNWIGVSASLNNGFDAELDSLIVECCPCYERRRGCGRVAKIWVGYVVEGLLDIGPTEIWTGHGEFIPEGRAVAG